MLKTDTPLTDALFKWPLGRTAADKYEAIDAFCRRLEREREELMEALRALTNACMGKVAPHHPAHEAARALLARLKETT